MDTPRLIAQARQLRSSWEAGDYVSVAQAVAVANRLADMVEADGGRGRQHSPEAA